MTRTDILNGLVSRFGYKSYLEIGVKNPMDNFEGVRAEKKVGVDPDPGARASFCGTSDAYFREHPDTFDLVFIDGLHTAAQVREDIRHALLVLNKGGTIVLHDCNPPSEPHQWEDMDAACRAVGGWFGTPWKAFVEFRKAGDNKYHTFTVDTDCGCAIITEQGTPYAPTPLTLPDELTWEGLAANRNIWLGLWTTKQFNAWVGAPSFSIVFQTDGRDYGWEALSRLGLLLGERGLAPDCYIITAATPPPSGVSSVLPLSGSGRGVQHLNARTPLESLGVVRNVCAVRDMEFLYVPAEAAGLDVLDTCTSLAHQASSLLSDFDVICASRTLTSTGAKTCSGGVWWSCSRHIRLLPPPQCGPHSPGVEGWVALPARTRVFPILEHTV